MAIGGLIQRRGGGHGPTAGYAQNAAKKRSSLMDGLIWWKSEEQEIVNGDPPFNEFTMSVLFRWNGEAKRLAAIFSNGAPDRQLLSVDSQGWVAWTPNRGITNIALCVNPGDQLHLAVGVCESIPNANKTIKIWVDGAESDQSNVHGIMRGHGFFMDGIQAGVWDRALHPDEIAELWNNGQPVKYPFER